MSDDLRAQFDRYIGDLFTQEDPTLKQIQANTSANAMPSASIQAFEGYLLQWLMRLVGVQSAVEIGTLAGYSATWIARALPADGRLYTVEKSAKHADVARQNLDLAGLRDKVTVIQGEALDMLSKLEVHGPYDMVFFDADKENMLDYLTWAVANLRDGGIVTAHNAFRGGRVLQPETDADAAMARFNAAIADHPHLDGMIIPIGDGMAVGIKRTTI